MIKPTLALLNRLKQEGKLDGLPLFGVEFLRILTDDLVYCEAAPGAIVDLESIGSQRFDIAARLYAVRAAKLTGRRDVAGVIATAQKVCDIQAKNDKTESLQLADACAICAAGIDILISDGKSSDELLSVRKRCVERGFTLLSQGVDHGYNDAGRLEGDPVLKSLRTHPGYPAASSNGAAFEAREVRWLINSTTSQSP